VRCAVLHRMQARTNNPANCRPPRPPAPVSLNVVLLLRSMVLRLQLPSAMKSVCQPLMACEKVAPTTSDESSSEGLLLSSSTACSAPARSRVRGSTP